MFRVLLWNLSFDKMHLLVYNKHTFTVKTSNELPKISDILGLTTIH